MTSVIHSVLGLIRCVYTSEHETSTTQTGLSRAMESAGMTHGNTLGPEAFARVVSDGSHAQPSRLSFPLSRPFTWAAVICCWRLKCDSLLGISRFYLFSWSYGYVLLL